MDVAVTLVAGVVLRVCAQTRVSAGLLGLWEGVVVHQLAARSPSPPLDHCLAYGLRIALDLLLSKDFQRQLIVVVCSLVAATLSEATTPYAALRRPSSSSKRDKRQHRHSARTIPLVSTPLPPRVRAYHHPPEPTFTELSSAVPPIVVTQETDVPATTTTSDVTTTPSIDIPTIPPPTPPSFFLQEQTELPDDISPEPKPIQLQASTNPPDSATGATTTTISTSTTAPLDDALPVRPRTALASILENEKSSSPPASPLSPFNNHHPNHHDNNNDLLPTPPESGGDRSGPSIHEQSAQNLPTQPNSQRLSTIEELSGDDDPCLANGGHHHSDPDQESDEHLLPSTLLPPTTQQDNGPLLSSGIAFGSVTLPVPNAGLRFGAGGRSSGFSWDPLPVPVPVRPEYQQEEQVWGIDMNPKNPNNDPDAPIPGTPNLHRGDDGVLEVEIGTAEAEAEEDAFRAAEEERRERGYNDEEDDDPLLTPGARRHLDQETDNEGGRDELTTPIQAASRRDLPSDEGTDPNDAGLLSPLPLNVRSALNSDEEFMRDRSATPPAHQGIDMALEIGMNMGAGAGVGDTSMQGSISQIPLLQPPPSKEKTEEKEGKKPKGKKGKKNKNGVAGSPVVAALNLPEPMSAPAAVVEDVALPTGSTVQEEGFASASASVAAVSATVAAPATGKKKKKKQAQTQPAAPREPTPPPREPTPPPPPPPPPREPTPPPPQASPAPTHSSLESALSTNIPSKLYTRGDELRAEARLLEAERVNIEAMRKKAEQERDVGEALRLKIRLRDLDRETIKLHEKAARRYFVARNALNLKTKIDVHGLRSREAFERVELALLEVIRQGKDTLRVIVGKGLHSINNQPVLKNTVQREMLRQGFKCEVDTRNPGILIITVPKPSP